MSQFQGGVSSIQLHHMARLELRWVWLVALWCRGTTESSKCSNTLPSTMPKFAFEVDSGRQNRGSQMKYIALLISAVISAISIPAHSAVISGTVSGGSVNGFGSFVKLNAATAGFAVGNDNFNTKNLYAFDERQGVTLTAALAANLGLTNIAFGTRINSHFVFFDPRARETLQGNVTFDSPVIAAITLRPQLIGSNYLGNANVTYLTPASFGLEPGTDFVTLSSPDANSIRINFLTADSPGDHFRIITAAPVAAVPEPATWALMILGFGLIGGAIRQRNRQNSKSSRSLSDQRSPLQMQ
jgi:PEP-CTERM motif